MSCIDKIDWDLLVQQKLTLLHVLEHPGTPEKQVEDLVGIVHLLDALQDEFQPKPLVWGMP